MRRGVLTQANDTERVELLHQSLRRTNPDIGFGIVGMDDEKFDSVILIDSDAAVVGSLDRIFDAIDVHPVFVEDAVTTLENRGARRTNAGKFYDAQGVWADSRVLGYQPLRDAWLLAKLNQHGYQRVIEEYNLYSYILPCCEIQSQLVHDCDSVDNQPLICEPIKVGIFLPMLWMGGAEEWATHLVKYLDRQRINVVGVGVIDDKIVHPVALEMFREKPLHFGYSHCRSLASQCDVMITWFIDRLDKILPNPKPVVISVSHNALPNEYATRVFASQQVDHLVAISQLALIPIPHKRRRRTVIIPNTINLDRLSVTVSKEEMRRQLSIPADKRILGFIARPDRDKNPLLLSRAVKLLPEEWVVLYSGSALGGEIIMKEANDIAPGRVYHSESRRDIGNIFNILERMVLPSRTEASCLAAMEAAAFGVPLIMTPVGVVMENPAIARIIPIDCSPEQLADIILDDATHDAMVHSRTALAAHWMSEQYGNTQFANRWTNFILRVYYERNDSIRA